MMTLILVIIGLIIFPEIIGLGLVIGFVVACGSFFINNLGLACFIFYCICLMNEKHPD